MVKVDVYSSVRHLESDIIQTDNISRYIHDHRFIEQDTKFILSFIATKPSSTRSESMIPVKSRPRKDNSKNLPLQFLGKISLNYTKINSYRFLISSVIITISFLLILFIGSVYFFNSGSTISRYLNETQTKYVIPELNLSYIDRLNTQIELNVFKGEELYNRFTDESDNIYRVYSDIRITVTDNSIDQYYYVNYALMDNSTYKYQGTSPSSENEVMITDYLYEKLFGLDDDFLFPRYFRDVDGEKKVTGIVVTDYADRNYYNDDLREFYQEKVYSLVFVNDISSSYIDVNLVDPFGNNYVSFMSETDYDEYGSNILNSGEIIISSVYAEQYNINIGDRVFFLDYSSNENNIKYSNYLDINSLFGDGFIVLDILDTNEYIFVLSDSDYKTIYDNYLDYYSIDYFIVFRNESWDLSNNPLSDSISFEDPVIQIIMEIHAEFSRNNSLFYPLLLLSFTLAVLSLFNFVSAILHKKRKEVAIFQTLGVSYQDITRVFIIQGYILGVIGFLIAIPIYLLITKYVNSSFTDASEFGFNIFRANWGAVTIIFSSMIVLRVC